MNVHEAARLTEDEARAYLESIRWPNGPVCPHCGATERQMRLQGKAHRAGLLKCGACREQYSVTVDSVMHGSRIPLAKWVHAFHVLCAARKGISARQLQATLGFGSYRTAWHMAHRIRAAMRQEPLKQLLGGITEVDETFCGGKPRKGSVKRAGLFGRRKQGPAPDFKERKTPVLVAVQRDGELRSKVAPDVTGETLREFAAEYVATDAHLMTDERPAYGGIGRNYAKHDVVNHRKLEFARGIVHVNTAESHNAILKRSLVGTFHKVSKKHLQKYCDEVAFKWNLRRASLTERADAAVQLASGKRLTYRETIAQ